MTHRGAGMPTRVVAWLVCQIKDELPFRAAQGCRRSLERRVFSHEALCVHIGG